MFELNDKYKDCKNEKHEYLVNGKKCVVVRHYCGDKDLNKILYQNAFERAFSEVMTINEHSQKV